MPTATANHLVAGEMLSMREAAKMIGLCRWTLYSLERRGLLSFRRIDGNTFVSAKELLETPILTMGKAAKLVDRSWWTARKWRDAGILDVHYDFPGSKGRCSIIAITTAKEDWTKRDGRRVATTG